MPGWLCSHARAWSQRHLGTCRLSTLPAPCCVEKLLPGWLSSHAGAWSHGFDSNSVEECLGSHAGAWSQPDSPSFLVLSLSLSLHVFEPCQRRVVLRSCCLACCLRTPERAAIPAFWIHLPSWLGSHAGAWSQPGFWILVCLFLCCCLNGPFFLKTILPGWLCSHAGAWSQPGF